MVNINGKPWEELQFKDVQDYLSDPDSNENCFFEYKIDKVEPAKLVKEVSAFANTYGGYIFLGVDDNKNIIGCTAWDEQRIHITIHNGITPTPQFDVKRFSADDKESLWPQISFLPRRAGGSIMAAPAPPGCWRAWRSYSGFQPWPAGGRQIWCVSTTPCRMLCDSGWRVSRIFRWWPTPP